MALVRNVSEQTLIVAKMGGGVLQLMPGRAAQLSEAEQRSGQVQNLLQSGLLKIEERTVPPAAHVAKVVEGHKRGEGKHVETPEKKPHSPAHR